MVGLTLCTLFSQLFQCYLSSLTHITSWHRVYVTQENGKQIFKRCRWDSEKFTREYNFLIEVSFFSEHSCWDTLYENVSWFSSNIGMWERASPKTPNLTPHIPMLLENYETFSYRLSQNECSEKKTFSWFFQRDRQKF